VPFAGFKLHPSLLRGIKELGFTRPTPIQAEALPPALEGRDILGCAQTGSGKTAAFLLPILNRLIGKPRGTTRALVVTPTRELAAQIQEDLKDLAVHTPVTSAAIYGGVGMGPQEHALRSGVDVVIATPGRLLDHMRQPYTRLGGLEVLSWMKRIECWTWVSCLISGGSSAPCRSSGRRSSSAPRCRSQSLR
jgi:ATP-dependent RNA helicase RhlE